MPAAEQAVTIDNRPGDPNRASQPDVLSTDQSDIFSSQAEILGDCEKQGPNNESLQECEQDEYKLPIDARQKGTW